MKNSKNSKGKKKIKKLFKTKKVKVSDEEKQITNEKKEFFCAICFDVFFNPVIFPCSGKHKFCKECVESYINSKREHEADELDSNKKSNTKFKFKLDCPICREKCEINTKEMKVDKETVKKVSKKFEGEYKARKKEKKMEKENKAILLIGNKHRDYPAKKVGSKSGRCTHEWSCFVRLKIPKGNKKLKNLKIKKVQFELHKDFGIGKINCYKEPFIVTRKGWGEFDVKIWVFFEREYRRKPVFITHDLSFDKSGKFRKVEVDFSEKL